MLIIIFNIGGGKIIPLAPQIKKGIKKTIKIFIEHFAKTFAV